MACFLITGGAGFIGSNLARVLIQRGHHVRILDDFSTGRRSNLADILENIQLITGTICDMSTVDRAMRGVDFCLHHAAIPSVPRSVAAPAASHDANITGTLNVFLAARDAGVRRTIFASSSSVYGEVDAGPVTEDLPRRPISPYGVTKAAGEMYAEVFSRLYDQDIVVFRYFNVFGPYQNPDSQYAAVIPIFITRMLSGEGPPIYGDGRQARDFTYVDNVILANLLACEVPGHLRGIFNISCGAATSLLDLAGYLNGFLASDLSPVHLPARPGDIRFSCADCRRAQSALSYAAEIDLKEGLNRTLCWFRDKQEPG